MLIGSDDEAIDAEALADYFAEHAPSVEAEVLPHVNHIMLANDNGSFARILTWIREGS